MKKFCLRSLMIAAVALTPASAMAFRSWNQHDVKDVGNGVFEVVSRVGSVPIDYWCAAGDFARRKLKAKSTTPLYVWTPEGPSTIRKGYRAVQFSLNKPPNGDTRASVSITVRRAGENMAVSFAEGYCPDSQFYFLVNNDR